MEGCVEMAFPTGAGILLTTTDPTSRKGTGNRSPLLGAFRLDCLPPEYKFCGWLTSANRLFHTRTGPVCLHLIALSGVFWSSRSCPGSPSWPLRFRQGFAPAKSRCKARGRGGDCLERIPCQPGRIGAPVPPWVTPSQWSPQGDPLAHSREVFTG